MFKTMITMIALSLLSFSAMARVTSSSSWSQITKDKDRNRVTYTMPSVKLSNGIHTTIDRVCQDGSILRNKKSSVLCARYVNNGGGEKVCAEYRRVNSSGPASGTRTRCVDWDYQEVNGERQNVCVRYAPVSFNHLKSYSVAVYDYDRDAFANKGRKLFTKSYTIPRCN